MPVSLTPSPDIFEQQQRRIHRLSEYMNSSSLIALSQAIERRVLECLYHSDKRGKSYFDELLKILLYIPAGAYSSYSEENLRWQLPWLFAPRHTTDFYLPETTLTRISQERDALTQAEKQDLIQDIEYLIPWDNPLTLHLKSALLYLKNTLQVVQHYPSYTREKDPLPTEAEIIYLSDILAEARERTRFHHAENKYPPLTQKILDYQQRIQVWVWNLTNRNFAQIHDTLFRITQIILTTRCTPEFSMRELTQQIAQLWEFECQYFITALTKALSPETYTSQIPRMRILQEIQELLKTQRKDLHAMSHKA